MMTTRDWWIGVLLLSTALALHAALPRYDWRAVNSVLVRVDRWTGRAEWGYLGADGRWTSKNGTHVANLSDIAEPK